MTHTGSGASSPNHALRQPLPNRLPIPGTLSDQLLHGLHVALGQPRRHGLDRFAFAIQQQAAHINRTPVASLAPSQRLQQIDQELFQALSTSIQLGLGHAQT